MLFNILEKSRIEDIIKLSNHKFSNLNRKACNSYKLFVASYGIATTAKLFSIVQTARANGLKSEKYLAYVLSNINKKDINDLLPWSNKLPKDLLITNKDI